MTAISRGEVDRFVERPDPKRPIVLIYGPDSGLVTERAAAIATRSIGGSTDPLQLIRMDGDELSSDPLKLVDEANAVGLFGGRRAIRVKVGSRNIAPAIEQLTRTPPLDAMIVLEAGDLKKSAPLRSLCEKSPNAVVIACYSDEPAELRRVVDDSLAAASMSIEPDARDALLSLLGGDRLATRGEIEKLIAFVGEPRRVTIDDIEAIVGDAAATALGEAIDGAFAGDAAGMLPALAKLTVAGERPDMILTAALNHAWSLAQGLAQVEAGQAPRTVAERAIPFFRRRPSFERQLQIWRREGMAPTIRQLGDTILAARSRPDMAASQLDRMMLRIALSARRARN